MKTKTISNQPAKVTNKEAKAKKDKKAKAVKKEKTSKKEQEVIDEVVKQQKVELLEAVTTNREVKYKYPDNCTGTLERKRWRQAVRNELRKLERTLFRIHDENTKEYKEAKVKLEEYQAKVLKESVAIA